MGIMCIEALASERQNHDYQLIRSIETIATEAGRPIFRYDLNPQALANPDRLIEHCLADGLSGVVIVGVRDTEPLEPILTQLRDRNIPVAVCPLGRQSVAAGIQVTIINADDQLAGVVAAQHLYELGHRNLAVVSYQRSRPYIEQRIAGVQAVCQRHGLVSEADQFIRLPVKEMSASEHQRVGFEAFALLPAGTTGVFCMNDSVAAGLIEAAMKSGHQIGKTLSVVGHDSDVRYDDKQITTVVPPLAQIARWACDLLKVSAGSSTEIQRSERILLRPQLVWRRSTGPRGK
jgi:LacI family transcriptional regulator